MAEQRRGTVVALDLIVQAREGARATEVWTEFVALVAAFLEDSRLGDRLVLDVID